MHFILSKKLDRLKSVSLKYLSYLFPLKKLAAYDYRIVIREPKRVLLEKFSKAISIAFSFFHSHSRIKRSEYRAI